MKKNLLVFDLDDTLVDSELAYEVALNSISLTSRSPGFIEARKQVKMTLGDGHVAARNRWLYFKALQDRKMQFRVSEMISMIGRYEEVLLNSIHQQWIDLRRDILFGELKKEYELAILTNENARMQLLKLAAVDPEGKYFSRIVTSEEVGIEKPAEEIFRKLFSFFPDHQISEMTMIGDSWTCDIVPACQLGMNAIWTNEFKRDANEQVKESVTSIHDLNDLLKILLQK